ncbi:hypothetical protein [Thalassobacillus cyri]|uniref:hypothetical protein n=1 Tax=Thalassobacillus cyri TaxID=571932 RepID=UPI00115F8327|nr:hypothetical protein [Thalassobacillus cyri]
MKSKHPYRRNHNVVICGMDGEDVWRRCKERKAAGYIEVEPFHKVHTTTKRYHYDDDSIPRYSRSTFKSVDLMVKYRAVFRRPD